MSGIFDPENKVMQIGVKFADLLLVNAMTIVFSVPVVTMGAALSAMHDQVLKIWRDEQTGIIKGYWKAFRENLKQGTKLFLMYLLVAAVLGVDIYLIASDKINWGTYFNLFIAAVSVIYLFSFIWIFVLQSRYKLTIKDTIVFSFTRIIAFPIRTLGMALTLILPLLLAYYFAYLTILVFLLGITVPGILGTCFYNRALDVMEDDSEKVQAEAGESEEDDDDEDDFDEEEEDFIEEDEDEESEVTE